MAVIRLLISGPSANHLVYEQLGDCLKCPYLCLFSLRPNLCDSPGVEYRRQGKHQNDGENMESDPDIFVGRRTNGIAVEQIGNEQCDDKDQHSFSKTANSSHGLFLLPYPLNLLLYLCQPGGRLIVDAPGASIWSLHFNRAGSLTILFLRFGMNQRHLIPGEVRDR
jgi:hypothetical protein